MLLIYLAKIKKIAITVAWWILFLLCLFFLFAGFIFASLSIETNNPDGQKYGLWIGITLIPVFTFLTIKVWNRLKL